MQPTRIAPLMLSVRQTVTNQTPERRGMTGHFRREARIMSFFVVLVGISLLLGLLGPRIARWLAVDRCLDAGGSYNYQTRICEGARPGR